MNFWCISVLVNCSHHVVLKSPLGFISVVILAGWLIYPLTSWAMWYTFASWSHDQERNVHAVDFCSLLPLVSKLLLINFYCKCDMPMHAAWYWPSGDRLTKSVVFGSLTLDILLSSSSCPSCAGNSMIQGLYFQMLLFKCKACQQRMRSIDVNFCIMPLKGKSYQEGLLTSEEEYQWR